MIDLYLRAGNAGALASACPLLRGEDETGQRFWITSGDSFALDIIGQIVDDAGEVIDTGFHANLRCTEEIAVLVPDSVRVHPANPRRVWF